MASIFANTVARSFFTSKDLPPAIEALKLNALEPFQKNKVKLLTRFQKRVKKEQSLIEAKDAEGLKLFYETAPHVATSKRLDNERKTLAALPRHSHTAYLVSRSQAVI